ncbi:TPA: PLP-dependent aminotransferase family protein [Klebsiella pneumoniae]|nr:PLP-dependent aminotransferase family protein [Klebsiella pneumoniae]
MEAINLPLYQRIARQLKSAIERGELTPGSRLPASRVYAQEQGVSRATIENAWGELVAQGWLERRGQAGTFVSERLSPRQLAPVPPVQPAAPTEPLPFQMGLPALDLFPRGQWARVMGRRLRTQSRFDLAPGDPGGDPLLRQAIVDYLRLSRSIDCQPDQVLITGSYAASMNLILRTLAQPGQHMWMEDPGYPFIRPVVEAGQLAVDAIPVDDEGMDVGWGQRHHPQARFALLTPAHQSPLGVALSLPRRRQLLAWAAERQSCTVPTLWQQTLADFIQQGHFWRHLKKMRASYSQRRQWLESALQAQGFQVTPQLGGIQLVMSVSGDDRLLARRAVVAGLAVQALSDWRIRHAGEGGLLMSFTNIRSPAMADGLARRLREAIAI